jgi:hypothetical protein
MWSSLSLGNPQIISLAVISEARKERISKTVILALTIQGRSNLFSAFISILIRHESDLMYFFDWQ